MAITVYTYNDKILKNTATDKWLKKPDAPAGFVMDASNGTLQYYQSQWSIVWNSPTYPNAWQGEGKQYTVTINNEIEEGYALMYAGSSEDYATSGPPAIGNADMTHGTHTGTILNNQAIAGGYGAKLIWPLVGVADETTAQTILDNTTITILDP